MHAARIRRVLVGAFVLFHMGSVLIAALPAPVGGDDRRNYEYPFIRGEMERWSEILTSVGWELSPDDVTDLAYGISKFWLDKRRAVLKPLKPYQDVTGTKQVWRMFAGANQWPAVLRIEVNQGAGMRTVFETNGPQEFEGWMLEHELIRSMQSRYTSSRKYSTAWKRFARTIADRAVLAYPDATAVRVRILTRKSPTPSEARKGIEHPFKVRKHRSFVVIDGVIP